MGERCYPPHLYGLSDPGSAQWGIGNDTRVMGAVNMVVSTKVNRHVHNRHIDECQCKPELRWNWSFLVGRAYSSCLRIVSQKCRQPFWGRCFSTLLTHYHITYDRLTETWISQGLPTTKSQLNQQSWALIRWARPYSGSEFKTKRLAIVFVMKD